MKKKNLYMFKVKKKYFSNYNYYVLERHVNRYRESTSRFNYRIKFGKKYDIIF